MGRIAIIIAVSYGIVGGMLVIVIGALVWSSTRRRHRAIDAHKLAEREKTWFGIVVVVLVALLFGTIFFTPYGRGAASQNNDDTTFRSSRVEEFGRPVSGAPQNGQNGNSPGNSLPQLGQVATNRV